MTKYFENWVKRMNASFWDSASCSYSQYFGDSGGGIITVLNVKTGKTGIAKCHPDDNYNINIGRAIAYARCCGKLVPDMNYEPKKKEKNQSFIYILTVQDKQTNYTLIKKYTVANMALDAMYEKYKKYDFNSVTYTGWNNFQKWGYDNFNRFSCYSFSNEKADLSLIRTKKCDIITE